MNDPEKSGGSTIENNAFSALMLATKWLSENRPDFQTLQASTAVGKNKDTGHYGVVIGLGGQSFSFDVDLETEVVTLT